MKYDSPETAPKALITTSSPPEARVLPDSPDSAHTQVAPPSEIAGPGGAQGPPGGRSRSEAELDALAERVRRA